MTNDQSSNLNRSKNKTRHVKKENKKDDGIDLITLAIEKKQPKWKQQSNRLRSAMMAAKGKMAQNKTNGDVVVQVDDGLKPCPHCHRRFSEKAAERHIPKCKNIKAKPKTLRRGAGTGAGAGAFKNPVSTVQREISTSSSSTASVEHNLAGSLRLSVIPISKISPRTNHLPP